MSYSEAVLTQNEKTEKNVFDQTCNYIMFQATPTVLNFLHKNLIPAHVSIENDYEILHMYES